MKKRILFLAMMGIIIFSIFCLKDKNITKNGNNHLVNVNYDKSMVKEKQELRLNDLETSCMVYEPIMENYVGESDLIIIGSIKNIEYYEYEGLPWSKLNVKIIEVLQGNIKTGKHVNVYVMEGYQYNNKEKTELIELSGDEIGLHQIGERVILNLKEENGDTIFEKGSYRRTFSCFSEYRFDKRKNSYHIYEGEKEKYLGKKAIVERIDKFSRK